MKCNWMFIRVVLSLVAAVLVARNCPAADSGLGAGAQASRDELRQQQGKELDDLRSKYDRRARNEVPRNSDGSIKTDSRQYKKLLDEYKQKNGEIKDRYKAKDPLAGDFDPKNKIEGVESTGSKPKDVRADGDWSANSPEATKKKLDQWKQRGDTVIDDGYKKRNTTTDEVLWDPAHANDPKKVSDPDAYSTAGGKEKTGAGGVKDDKGYVLDNEKKYLDGKERGNLKDQAKSVSKAGEATGRANAPENAGFYKKAKDLRNYGDDVTAGISDLGDAPAVRDQKLKDFQAKQDAEMIANKAEATKTSDAKQQVRENLADSAKKAETTGNSEWDKARNKANYGDTPTTSEAIGDRHAQVKDSNKAAETFNDSMRDKIEGKKGSAPDGMPESAKTGKATPLDAPDSAIKPGGPDAPKAGVEGPDGMGAKSGPKVEGPEGPKVSVEGPDGAGGAKAPAGSGVKGKLIKGINIVGEGMNAVDILSTAEEVKTDIQKGDYKGAATKTAEATANQATLGAYGAVKSTGEKVMDKSDAQSNIDQANKTNEEHYDQQAAMKLQKAGVSRDEIKRIMDAKAKGDESALSDKFNQLGVKAPEKIVEKGPTGDDTAGERAEAVAKGMADGVKKAGKFVNDARKDLTEIGTGMTEKGVAGEVVGQTKENVKGWYDVFKDRNKPEETVAEGKQAMVDRLVARGATPEGAQKAADGMYDKGDSTGYKRLTDMLNKRNNDSNLSDKEGKSDGDGGKEKGDGKSDGKSGGLLDQVASAKDSASKDKTQAGIEGMQETHNGEKAATSGDKDSRDAKSTVNKAGAEAGATRDQSTRDTAQAEKDNSMGKKLGDALEDSLKKGAESFGGTVGAAGADKVNEKTYKGDRKDKDKDNGDSKDPSEPKAAADTGTSKSPAKEPSSSGERNTTPEKKDPMPQGQGSGDGNSSGAEPKSTASNGPESPAAPVSTPAAPGATPAVSDPPPRPVIKKPPEPVYETVTCPGCGRKLKALAGTGIMCPYCVTMDCPECGFKKCYDRGTEPSQCPVCAARRAAAAAAAAAASAAGGGGGGGGGSK